LVTAEVDDHFYLINNAQWQTIARNIESDERNRIDGVYPRGHSDNEPPQSCDGYTENVKDDCSTPDDTAPHLQKRTLILTNDEVIWDFAGNLRESVIDKVGVGETLEPTPDLRVSGSI